MLLDNETLEGIVSGRIRVVFRTWRRPTVKSGGTLRTRSGVLAIEAVDLLTPDAVTAKDLKLAGFADRAAFLRSLEGRQGALYRIRVHLAGEDPRIALRQKAPGPQELADIDKRLKRMDAASELGPWTQLYLELIRDRPAQRAPELAELFGLETQFFKTRVRRLKELGLTESLPVGYRLSPRGQLFLQFRSQQPSAAGAAAPRKPRTASRKR
jgi:hypothetical protein